MWCKKTQDLHWQSESGKCTKIPCRNCQHFRSLMIPRKMMSRMLNSPSSLVLLPGHRMQMLNRRKHPPKPLVTVERGTVANGAKQSNRSNEFVLGLQLSNTSANNYDAIITNPSVRVDKGAVANRTSGNLIPTGFIFRKIIAR